MPNKIKLKDVIPEDFINYMLPSMFLVTCKCDWKCCKEDPSICQNNPISNQPDKEFTYEQLYNMFVHSDLSKSIVIGGLEPFLQFDEVIGLIQYFRERNDNSTFVIYTGYDKKEIKKQIKELERYKGIIVKYGRYIPNQKEHYDMVLGIFLSSDNQYAEIVS